MTQDELKARLHYDPETGVFTWLDNPTRPKHWRSRYVGQRAGTFNAMNYEQISLDKTQYYAHRLAFLYMCGFIPEEIDHIDGNPSNNAFSNLRPANRSINMKNLCRNSVNTSGKTGLGWDRNRNKWLAYINVDGKRVHNKRFANRLDAEKQRDEWSKKYGFHENHGR